MIRPWEIYGNYPLYYGNFVEVKLFSNMWRDLVPFLNGIASGCSSTEISTKAAHVKIE
jgi:hypothetical protein